MPTYLSLLNWTDQGIKNVKDSPKRLDAVKKAVKGIGGEVKAFYMLQGAYDLALIMEAPNDEALAKTTTQGRCRRQRPHDDDAGLSGSRVPKDHRRAGVSVRDVRLQIAKDWQTRG